MKSLFQIQEATFIFLLPLSPAFLKAKVAFPQKGEQCTQLKSNSPKLQLSVILALNLIKISKLDFWIVSFKTEGTAPRSYTSHGKMMPVIGAALNSEETISRSLSGNTGEQCTQLKSNSPKLQLSVILALNLIKISKLDFWIVSFKTEGTAPRSYTSHGKMMPVIGAALNSEETISRSLSGNTGAHNPGDTMKVPNQPPTASYLREKNAYLA
ncbi:hypothetical protein H920_16175 [Fukomys damarensis]|uniref:Uncharacterized protein n=1 Tax=Fukomys damarensis TaxID=885580 RepID=A0A091CSY3_FUKDA|nr:hypothetical protein H920_16175 [Fukomys damarensis]